MIYLDYSATTPVDNQVIDSMNKVMREYIGNVSSLHGLGIKANELFMDATSQIADLFGVKGAEIIYTSGATEANNLAIKGVALEYQNRGKHIITSKLEHPSIYAILEYLETLGFEISYVNNDSEGLVDFEHLKSLIRKDTILVSIVAVNSELGIRQPLKFIKQIISKQNPNTLFHSDMTQAVGKVPVNFKDVDMFSMSAHKIYGPKGIGLLYKSAKINLTPVIHGSSKVTDIRPGTIPLPLVAGLAKALRLALENVDKNESYVKELSDKLVDGMKSYEGVELNVTKYSIPHILNFTFYETRPETIIHALDEYDIYVGTNTACATGDLSSSVMAVYGNKKRSLSTIRVSISAKSKHQEINAFLGAFDEVYKKIKEMSK